MESIPSHLSHKTSQTAPLLIEARGLSKRLQRREVLQSVDFSIHEGEIVTLIGPNGCGKTTLLRCLLNLTRPDKGRIRRKKDLQIGYVPQQIYFDANLPLNVKSFLQLTNPRPVDARSILEMTKVSHLFDRQMRHLSGGERQRVLLAQALLNNPELLVLDEPVQGVDFSGQAEFYQLIRSVSRIRKCAVLMVSHDLHLVMAGTDKVLCLNGHICCSGTPQTVSRDPAFISLFGEETSRQIAFYSHDHDHEHSVDGEVIHHKHHHGGQHA